MGAPKKISPLPWRQLIPLSFVILSEPINLTILFPFVVFMIEDFGIAEDRTQVGTYVGFVAAAFAAAQTLTALPWGWVSDRVGRRPVLLLGLLGQAGTMCMFGLSQNYAMAVASRALTGFLNGNVGVAKSVLAEVTDETNRGVGFSLFGFLFGIGIIIGPVLGGFFARPAQTWPGVFPPGGFWDKNAYFLPCLIAATISTMGFVVALFFLDETAPARLDRKRSVEITSTTAKTPLVAERKPAWYEQWKDLLTDPLVMMAIGLYCAIAFVTILFDELYALWVVQPPPVGFNFEPGDIGGTLTWGGVTLVITQLLIYPRIQRVMGPLNVGRLGFLVLVPVYFAFPWVSLLGEKGVTAEIWPALIIGLCLRAFGTVLCFTAMMLLITHSARRSNLGSVNGLAQMAGSFWRAVGPAAGGTLWSWSLRNDLSYPLDFHFLFLLCSLVLAVAVLFSLAMPSSINRPRERYEARALDNEQEEIEDPNETMDEVVVETPRKDAETPRKDGYSRLS